MRYTIAMSDITKQKREPGPPPGSRNNPDGRPIKGDTKRDARINARVPQNIKDALANVAESEGDAIIAAVKIAEAHGWQMPSKGTLDA